MKLGLIEVSGIKNVVFYKNTHWLRVLSNNGTVYWVEASSGRTMSNDALMYNVKTAVYNAKKRVWVEGDTVNIDRLKMSKGKVIEVDIPYLNDDGSVEKRKITIVPTR